MKVRNGEVLVVHRQIALFSLSVSDQPPKHSGLAGRFPPNGSRFKRGKNLFCDPPGRQSLEVAVIQDERTAVDLASKIRCGRGDSGCLGG